MNPSQNPTGPGDDLTLSTSGSSAARITPASSHTERKELIKNLTQRALCLGERHRVKDKEHRLQSVRQDACILFQDLLANEDLIRTFVLADGHDRYLNFVTEATIRATRELEYSRNHGQGEQELSPQQVMDSLDRSDLSPLQILTVKLRSLNRQLDDYFSVMKGFVPLIPELSLKQLAIVVEPILSLHLLDADGRPTRSGYFSKRDLNYVHLVG